MERPSRGMLSLRSGAQVQEAWNYSSHFRYRLHDGKDFGGSLWLTLRIYRRRQILQHNRFDFSTQGALPNFFEAPPMGARRCFSGTAVRFLNHLKHIVSPAIYWVVRDPYQTIISTKHKFLIVPDIVFLTCTHRNVINYMQRQDSTEYLLYTSTTRPDPSVHARS